MSSQEFKEAVKEAASEFKDIDKNEQIRIISHLDSDGISAVSILVKALHYEKRNYVVSIVPQLDRNLLKLISKEQYNVFVFCDLGSGNLGDIEDLFKEKKVFVLDHHKPKKDNVSENIVQVNPHLFGIDGSKEISGAGVCYFFAKEIDERVKEMSAIAIVGAIGDVQEDNGFLELNNEILDDAVSSGKIKVQEGDRVDYMVVGEEEDSLSNVREFSTVLNACGRMSKGSIGIGACLGDENMKGKAVSCLNGYREQITKAMDWFNANRKTGNVIEKDRFMIINAKDKVLGTIIGTIASMISKSETVKEGTYVMSMAHLIDSNTKISLRVSGKRKDVDLRETMKEIIGKLGSGEFGGHKYAAGALIPTSKEDEFLDISKQVLEKRSLEEEVN